MTRQHFRVAAQLVADILASPDRDSLPLFSTSRERALATADAFCLLFAQFNPRFNRSRFRRACGLVD